MLPTLRPVQLHPHITDLVQFNDVNFVEHSAARTGIYQRLNPCSTLVKQLKASCLDNDRYAYHTHGFGKKKGGNHKITKTVLTPKSAIGQFGNSVTTRGGCSTLH